MKTHARGKTLVLLVSTILSLLLGGCGPSQPVKIAPSRYDKWVNDIDYLAEELPKRHKNLFFSLDRADFYRETERIKQQVNKWTDDELKVAITGLVASVGDGHTMIYPDFRVMYPLRLYWFKEGIYVLDASEEYQEAISLKLVTINGKPIDEVLTALGPIISCDNEAGFKYYVPSYMLAPWVLRGLGISDSDHVTMGFLDSEGQKVVLTMYPEETQSIQYVASFSQRAGLPLYLRHPALYYWYEYIPQHNTVYFQYNVCANMPDQSFQAFTDELFEFIDHNRVERLVVDLRSNGGGNSSVMSPFIGRVKRSALNDADKLFVIIGRRTFSSALLNALDLKQSTKATFVGEATGGKPNHYGEVRTLFLPNTGLTVGYSTKYFRKSREDADSLLPDVIIEPIIAAFTKGQDPVMNWILQ